MGAARKPATTFGKYSLVARIARGGMAEILLARLQGAGGFEKLVCIKRVLPHLVEDPLFVQMFLGEARIAAMISHQNVCQVFELGEIDGSYFIAMEYLEGVPLSAFRKDELYTDVPDPRLVVGIGVQACEGLHHAHQLAHPDGSTLDLVHRDVSGQNLFVTTSGVVKVLDFGIAKAQDVTMRTSTGALKGTYAYMAPEQLRGEPIDRRADVFAMGIVMWETLAQRTLFRRDTEFLTFQAITTERVPNVCEIRPELPAELGAVVAKALSRDRNERYSTAREFGNALAQSVAPIGGPATIGAIADAVAAAFPAQLRDQRGLARLAHAGVQLDLASELPTGAELDTAMTTPASDHRVPVPINMTARSETLPVRPMAPPRSSRSRMIVIGATVALVAGLGLLAMHFATSSPKEPTTMAITQPVADAAIAQVAPPADAGAVVSPPAPADAGAASQTTRHPPPLPPPPVKKLAPGYLTIDSTPVYATIFIDGKPYGETPLFKLELPAGKHVIHAVSPTKAVQDQRVVVEPGQIAARRIEW